MRLRNVKNKDILVNDNHSLINNPEEKKGIWKEVFKNENPIEIEIGMGKGDFIISKALNNPNINFIGIEKYDSVIIRAIEKITKPIPNLKLIRMDAINIDNIFAHEIDKIYLNFSDPWPKKRHSNRRLTSSTYLKKYDEIFTDTKIICQKTDNSSLFEYSIISLSQYGYTIEAISLDLHNSDIINESLTEYEKKFTSLGEKIKYLEAKK